MFAGYPKGREYISGKMITDQGGSTTQRLITILRTALGYHRVLLLDGIRVKFKDIKII